MIKQKPLSLAESREFTRLESIVERGLTQFAEVGNALAEIRDGKLYRNCAKTFEIYLVERWNISRAHGYRLINAAGVVNVEAEMSPSGDKIETESEARGIKKRATELEKETGDDPEESIKAAIDEFRAEKAEKQRIEDEEKRLAKERANLEQPPSKKTQDGIDRAASHVHKALKIIQRIRLDVDAPDDVEEHLEISIAKIKALIPINREGKRAA